MWLWLGSVALAQYDAGFEHGQWAVAGEGSVVDADAEAPHGGARSLRVVRDRREGFASGSAVILLDPEHVGQTVRLAGWVRTEAVRGGYAGWWARVDGAGGSGSLAFDNMNGRGARGTTEWSELSLELTVPEGAQQLVFGPILIGKGAAWFDDLALTVGDQRMDGRDLPQTARAQAPDLWTDEARRTVEDPRAAEVPDDWVTSLAAAAAPLRSLVSEDFGDLGPLGAAIGDARVVQLGESSHGVSEFNHAKVRLIKYLHEERGFDVVAFEGGIWECARADASVGEVAPRDVMARCLFGVWDTAEVEQLFVYLERTRATDRPLRLVGFDVQSSSAYAESERTAFFARVYGAVDRARGDAVAALDTKLTTAIDAASRPPIPLDAELAAYDSHIAWASAQGGALRAAGVSAEDVAFAEQLLRSRRAFCLQWSASGEASSAARDAGMAANLVWLAEQRFPGEKLVVWAHNGHVGYVGGLAAAPQMGSYLRDHFGDAAYTVGLYGYRGATSFNNRLVVPVRRGGPGSLEALMYQLREQALFVDLRGLPPADWADQTIPTLSWGRTVEPLTLRDSYDGLLFVDTLTPPAYLNR
jgi:erythromycin esterase